MRKKERESEEYLPVDKPGRVASHALSVARLVCLWTDMQLGCYI